MLHGELEHRNHFNHCCTGCGVQCWRRALEHNAVTPVND